MDNSQKELCGNDYDGEGGKVHIPDTFEDLDSNSDSFGLKIQLLTGLGDSASFLLNSKMMFLTNTFGLWKLKSIMMV